MQYGESCDECGDPEPGGVYVSPDRTLCEPCFERIVNDQPGRLT